MGAWSKLSREAQLAILAVAITSSSSLACSLCCQFVICDPPPPTPSADKTATPIRRATPTPTMMICDPPPPSPTPKATRTPVKSATPTPTMMICDPPPPSPSTSGSRSPLPLAHGLEVRVVQMGPGALDFAVERPMPGGDVQWTVTGGALTSVPDDGVRWEPPARPGRCMLQAVVDWGADGLAVHSLVLTVLDDCSVVVG